MKPETALKIEYSPFQAYTRIQVEAVRDEWISAYRGIAKGDPSKEELCRTLIDRIRRAAELFLRRYVEPAVSDAISHDDYYYEWLDEMKQEDNSSLDGDFPLGKEEDMKFALPYFSIKEFAMIHVGFADEIFAGHYVEYADRILVRMGILAEVKGDYHGAAYAYGGISTSKMIQEREYACRRKIKEG